MDGENQMEDRTEKCPGQLHANCSRKGNHFNMRDQCYGREFLE